MKPTRLLIPILLITFIQACDPLVSRDSVRVKAARAQIGSLHEALKNFKDDTGSFPGQVTGLDALVIKPTRIEGWRGPYLSGIPKDPWGNDYVYRISNANVQRVTIICYGADGRKGGEGFDADIVQ